MSVKKKGKKQADVIDLFSQRLIEFQGELSKKRQRVADMVDDLNAIQSSLKETEVSLDFAVDAINQAYDHMSRI